MTVILTVKQAAESRGIATQTQFLNIIKEKTGVEMRPSTLSAMYRNNQTTINREHLATVMQALDTKDFNEVLTIGDK